MLMCVLVIGSRCRERLAFELLAERAPLGPEDQEHRLAGLLRDLEPHGDSGCQATFDFCRTGPPRRGHDTPAGPLPVRPDPNVIRIARLLQIKSQLEVKSA